MYLIAVGFVGCIIQTLINKVGVGLNSKDDLLTQSQCERVSGKSTTLKATWKKNKHLPFSDQCCSDTENNLVILHVHFYALKV